MDESPQSIPARRGEKRDNEVLGVRPDADPAGSAGGLRPPAAAAVAVRFIPPISAIGPLFRYRFERIHPCRIDYDLDINQRATTRVLGGYYKSRRLVRLYVRDREQGLRSLEELFDTFLHEMAHHLEYTEPFTFAARSCGRVPGRMHSRLFWRILGELKLRWAQLQRQSRQSAQQAR